MESFLFFFKNVAGLSAPEALDFLATHAIAKHLKKGDFLVEQGAALNFAFYVERGLLKQSFLSPEGKEYIYLFWMEERYESNIGALLNKGQSFRYDIQAIEDSVVYVIPHSILEKLYLEHTDFAHYNNTLLDIHIVCARERVSQLMSENAEKRYANFLEQYGAIANRLPLSIIAAYLGITRESLSRLRAEMAHQHKGKA